MACYHPLQAWYSRVGVHAGSGKRIVVFKPDLGDPETAMLLPCGHCIGCRLEKSRQWAIRCLHEASLHENNCFVTLTYSDENLRHVVDRNTGELLPTLYKRDFTLFMKRLRKRFGNGIRFFMCGEYGEKFFRPHYHAILFNHDFSDKQLFKVNHRIPLYVSDALRELWPYGFSTVGNVTFESAAYVARYVTKKITGDIADDHYCGRIPEFVNCSRRPGIARRWYEKYRDNVYDNDMLVVRDSLKARPPRYYDRLYDLQFPEKFDIIRQKRVKFAKLNLNDTPERLGTREKVQLLKFKKLIRPLESNSNKE